MSGQDPHSESDDAGEHPPSSGTGPTSGSRPDRPRPFADSAKTRGGQVADAGTSASSTSSESSGTDRHDSAGDAVASQPPPTPLTQQIGRVVVVLLAVAFGVFAVANSQPVEFSWLFGETRVQFDAAGERVGGGVPLIVLLVGSLAIGVAVGMAISWQRARSRRRANVTAPADEPKKRR